MIFLIDGATTPVHHQVAHVASPCLCEWRVHVHLFGSERENGVHRDRLSNVPYRGLSLLLHTLQRRPEIAVLAQHRIQPDILWPLDDALFDELLVQTFGRSVCRQIF